MSLLRWFQWIDNTPVSVAFRNSHVAVPIIEIIHLLGITLALGTIMVVDLSILGVAMRRQSVPRIAGELARWTSAGFAITLPTGVLLFWSEAMKMYCKPLFWEKLALLVVAMTFHLTAHRKVIVPEPPVTLTRARLTAGLSLALWFGVAFGGKAVGLFG
jgi:hypothetical protein